MCGLVLYADKSFFCWKQSWDSFFRNSSGGAAPGNAYQAPPSLAAPGKNQVPISSIVPHLGVGAGMPSQVSEKLIDDHLSVQGLIRSYQVSPIVSALIEVETAFRRISGFITFSSSLRQLTMCCSQSSCQF